MVQYFIAGADTFKYLYFPSTIADTSHIPSTMSVEAYRY